VIWREDIAGRLHAKLCGQADGFAFRLGFMIVLALLLDPKDFGLVAMVTVITGIYGMFTSLGLSSATVQKVNITGDQISTLFWINMLIGALLAILCLATAPVLVAFYHEPRLLWVTATMAMGFLINAAGVQHQALLQRHLRYVTVTVIDGLSQLASIVVGIGLALGGFSYWALVGAMLTSSGVATAGAWLTARWLPGRSRWNAGIATMLHFGGTITLNSLVSYSSYISRRSFSGGSGEQTPWASTAGHSSSLACRPNISTRPSVEWPFPHCRGSKTIPLA
jgi:PST family polysaccharide transporter